MIHIGFRGHRLIILPYMKKNSLIAFESVIAHAQNEKMKMRGLPHLLSSLVMIATQGQPVHYSNPGGRLERKSPKDAFRQNVV